MNKSIKSVESPVINFTLVLVCFLLVYSLCSTLFDRLITEDSVINIVIKRGLQLCIYIIFIAIIHKKSKVSIKEYFKCFTFKNMFLAVISVVLFIFVYENTLQVLINSVSNEASIDNNMLDKVSLIGVLLQGLIIAPFAEEILIRGYLFKTLSRKYSLITSVIISNIFFMCLHFNYINTIFYFLGGCLLSLIYLRTKSLWGSIISHFLVNLIYIISGM